MADVTVSDATKIRPLLPSMITHTGAAGEALTLGQWVQRDADGNWTKTDASTQYQVRGEVGVVVSGNKADNAGAIASGEKIDVLVFGRVAGFGNTLDEDAEYWLSATAGKMTTTKPTKHKRAVGYAESTAVFFVNPQTVAES